MRGSVLEFNSSVVSHFEPWVVTVIYSLDASLAKGEKAIIDSVLKEESNFTLPCGVWRCMNGCEVQNNE